MYPSQMALSATFYVVHTGTVQKSRELIATQKQALLVPPFLAIQIKSEKLNENADSRVLDKTDLTLNGKENNNSLSSLLNELASIIIDIGDALSNHLFEMLRIHYKELETFIKNF